MMKWRHAHCEADSHLRFVAAADTLGDDGWELVHVETIDGYGPQRRVWIGIFRRAAESPAETTAVATVAE